MPYKIPLAASVLAIVSAVWQGIHGEPIQAIFLGATAALWFLVADHYRRNPGGSR